MRKRTIADHSPFAVGQRLRSAHNYTENTYTVTAPARPDLARTSDRYEAQLTTTITLKGGDCGGEP